MSGSKSLPLAQCIVRGRGLELGFGLENKERSKKIKGTTKPLLPIVDSSQSKSLPNLSIASSTIPQAT